MAVNIGELRGTIDLDDKFSAKIGKAGKVLGGFGKAALGVTAAITAAAAAAGVALAIFGKKALDAAVEAEESENLFQESFSGMADAAREWSIETSKALGLNEFEIRRQAATLFVMTESMGVASKEAYGMATSLTILAADMASFYNLPHEIAFKKLQGVITGEVEGLKTLGIVLKNTVVAEVARKHGILKVGEQMTEQIKIQARYLAIMEQTIKSQGDLARTLESPANAQRILNSQMDQFMVVMGRSIIPAYQLWIKGMSEVLQFMIRNQEQIKLFIRNGLVFLTEAMQATIFAFRELNAWLGTVRRGFEFVALGARVAGEAHVALSKTLEFPLTAAKNWRNFRDRVAEHTITTKENIRKIDKQEKSVKDVALAMGKVVNSFKETLTSTEEATGAAESFSGEMKDVEEGVKAVDKATEEWNKTLEDMATHSMRMMEDETRKLREEAKKAREEYEKWKIAQLADEAAMSLKLMEEEMEEFANEAERAAEEAERLKNVKMAGFFKGLVLLTGLLNDDLAAMAQIIQNIGDEFANATTKTEKFYAIASAVGQLGGQIGGKWGGAMQGAAGGAQTGMAFGPWGAVIGGVVGGVMGYVRGAQAAEIATNDLRDAFFEAQGGWEAFAQRLREGGWDAERIIHEIWDAKTVDEFNAAVQRTMDLLNLQAEAQRLLTDAIERYGFTIDELGPAWARQELDKRAAELLRDFKLLVASGIDVEIVIGRMSEALIQYIKDSIAAGIAIPEAFRPIIDQLIKQGLLLDENGDAYENAEDAGIKFAETMSEQFQRLIDKINDLVNALLGIGDVPIPNVEVPVVPVYPRGKPGGGGSGGGAPVEDYIPFKDLIKMQHGGIATRPTAALIGEAGPEAVVPLKGSLSNEEVVAQLEILNRAMEDMPESLRRAMLSVKAFS